MLSDQISTLEKKYTFRYPACCNMCGATKYFVLGKRLNQSQGKNPRTKIGITTTVVKCSNCGLIYANPLPIPDSLQDHYGIPPENYWKEEYFKIDENYFQQEIATLKSIREFKNGDKALDIGAGLGKCMIALSKEGFDVYGIEPSKPFYERAIQTMGIHADRLSPDSIETARLEDDFFDFITFGAVLEHLYDPALAIEKALRGLKPGGIIQIEVPSSHWLIGRLINSFYRLRGLDYVGNISPMHEPFHLYEFTLKSFRENAKIKGYEVVHFDHYVAQTYLPRLLNVLLVPYMRLTQTGMQLCVWLRKS